MAPFIFIGCEKSNEQLGFKQVIGEVPEVADTSLDVITYTRDIDSILVAYNYDTQLALGGYRGSRMVGNMTDGHFGQARAGIVSQVFLEETSPDFGTDAVVDSAVLYLRYVGAYGDTSKPMSLEVHTLTDTLGPNQRYYSDYDPKPAEKIGEKLNFYPQPHTPLKINGVYFTPRLAIPLDSNFIQQKIVGVANGSNPEFASNDQFKEYFKGLYIEAVNPDGAILFFDLSALSSQMVIYYHNADTTNLQFALDFNQIGLDVPINFNVFEQDYSGAYPVSFNLNNMNTTEGEELMYVEAMGGVAGVVEIPGLKGLMNKGVMINRATLEIHKASGAGNGLAPPQRLIFSEFEGNGLGSVIPDFAGDNASIGDGNFRSQPFHQGVYKFDLTRYVFDVANGGDNIKLALIPSTRSTAANRVILQGTKSENPVKLKIYYTKNP